eukprot:Gregarina_sp_Poly_1__5030@NODE_2667_length_1852_cov_6_126050_g1693_i0_p1_GENE_NODE_2667_length_1852_cov_6_126050_g1693_i0NODE_2667_length_1852_cov_6_126050_g1693_i0_p1_ORF_typecomplete_len480_score52_33SirB/PF04247_12/0_004SirB/PF04247_12/9_1e02DUF3341/PF11821_8/7_2e03DUF3341/PF11821_8/1_4e03DUF3341/PF11821_8/0_0069DUF2157/PF09925_9/0_035DUF2157/PF09925_9/4_2e03_NODE_2667_length_1852_cov_6_126050_g1693_i0571442
MTRERPLFSSSRHQRTASLDDIRQLEVSPSARIPNSEPAASASLRLEDPLIDAVVAEVDAMLVKVNAAEPLMPQVSMPDDISSASPHCSCGHNQASLRAVLLPSANGLEMCDKSSNLLKDSWSPLASRDRLLRHAERERHRQRSGGPLAVRIFQFPSVATTPNTPSANSAAGLMLTPDKLGGQKQFAYTAVSFGTSPLAPGKKTPTALTPYSPVVISSSSSQYSPGEIVPSQDSGSTAPDTHLRGLSEPRETLLVTEEEKRMRDSYQDWYRKSTSTTSLVLSAGLLLTAAAFALLRNWFLTMLAGTLLIVLISLHRAALMRPDKPFRLLCLAAACVSSGAVLLFAWIVNVMSLAFTDWDNLCPGATSQIVSGITCDMSYKLQFALTLFLPLIVILHMFCAYTAVLLGYLVDVGAGPEPPFLTTPGFVSHVNDQLPAPLPQPHLLRRDLPPPLPARLPLLVV